MTRSVLREKIATRLLFTVIVLLFATGLDRSVGAQGESPAATAHVSQVDPSLPDADFRFSIEANSRFGVFTYVPEQWGELHLSLTNRRETPRDLLCTSYFGDQTTLQFGRQVWLPARSRLNIAHPVLIPEARQFQDNSSVVHSLVIDRSQGSEVLVKNESGQLRHERALLMTLTQRNSGVVAGWNTEDFVPQDVLDLIVAGRVNQRLNNKLTVVSGQFLPADEASLRYLDHLVLAENRLVDDFAALAAVRRWLHAGGRLWIMLDRVDPVVLERLFGDDFQGHLVDRVGLTTVRVDKAPSLVSPDGVPGESIDYDEPVQMARMVVSGVSVRNTVDGWPAAMTRTFGEGRVLMTTLGPRGWIKPAPPAPGADSTERPPDQRADFVPLSPMEDLAAYVLAQRAPDALPPAVLEPLAQEYVAYTVPSWTLIVGTMCCFLASLLAIGIWLWKSDRLERFGWTGSLLAVLFGIVLTGFGMANRYRVPESIASVQLVQAVSGTDDVRTRGLIAVYRPAESPTPVGTAHGGRLWPDSTGADGSTRRMVTTDLGTFAWEGLVQPAGLQLYSNETAGTFSDRMVARATLDAQGIVGRYAGHPASGDDAVLATRSGRIGVDLAADGRLTAAAADVFETDQYLSATFLGDAQDRRRRILQQLLGNPTWQESLDRPQLLLWLSDWESGFQFGDGLQRQGETLLTVPLEITRPPTGTEILIPSPLVSFATCRPPDGSLPTGFWDDALHEWQERSGPSTTWLSFQLPRSLLPLQATQARLTVKVSGPIGRIEILGAKDGAVASLQTVENPVGSLAFEINDPEVLAVSSNGELSLGVSAGVTDQQAVANLNTLATANYWKIDSLALQLRAVTTELAEVDE